MPYGSTVLQKSASESSQGPTNNFFARWPDGIRGHIIAMLAEFVGTTAFLFFGFAAAQIANEKNDTLSPERSTSPSLLQIAYIATTFGISLAVNVWVFYRVSGGMFNPAASPPNPSQQSHTFTRTCLSHVASISNSLIGRSWTLVSRGF